MRPRRFLLLLVLLAGCRITDVPLWQPAEPPPLAFEVEHVRNVSYRGDSGSTHSHTLDLFLPRGLKDYPVVVLVHGGAWIMGDNRCCGLYSAVGEFFARRGIAAVLPNYRLSPAVKHPAHVQDVARAVAWTHEHIGKYGGAPDRLFLAGHSAGGHLVSLLASDDQYLRAEGMERHHVRGVITTSGVYRIPEGKFEVTLEGEGPRAFRLDHVLPIRKPSPQGRLCRSLLPGLPLKINVFGPAFGDDPQTRREASPIHHVRPSLPPFLIFHAENDLPTLAEMAREFHQELQRQGVEASLFEARDRNHNSILFRATEADDLVGQQMIAFIRRHCGGCLPTPTRPAGSAHSRD